MRGWRLYATTPPPHFNPDPAGATVERALPALGYTNVSQVHIGKVIRLVVDAADAGSARVEVEEMCERLLANPVIESYEVTVSALEPAQ